MNQALYPQRITGKCQAIVLTGPNKGNFCKCAGPYKRRGSEVYCKKHLCDYITTADFDSDDEASEEESEKEEDADFIDPDEDDDDDDDQRVTKRARVLASTSVRPPDVWYCGECAVSNTLKRVICWQCKNAVK